MRMKIYIQSTVLLSRLHHIKKLFSDRCNNLSLQAKQACVNYFLLRDLVLKLRLKIILTLCSFEEFSTAVVLPIYCSSVHLSWMNAVMATHSCGDHLLLDCCTACLMLSDFHPSVEEKGTKSQSSRYLLYIFQYILGPGVIEKRPSNSVTLEKFRKSLFFSFRLN